MMMMMMTDSMKVRSKRERTLTAATVNTGELVRTLTLVAVNEVDTCAAMLTRRRHAFVNFYNKQTSPLS